jgi:serine/threonine-protein kinase
VPRRERENRAYFHGANVEVYGFPAGGVRPSERRGARHPRNPRDASGTQAAIIGAMNELALGAANTLAGLGPAGFDHTLDASRAGTLVASVPGARERVSSLPSLALGKDAATDDLEIVSRLGEGGMGVVELARQRSLGREVALKRLRDPDDAIAAAALVSEAAVTGALEHPGIVPVHALGRDARGRPLMVMKKVEGVTLRTLLDEPEHARWREVDDRLGFFVGVVRRLADALSLAHARGWVHRDIKPENVMLGDYGEVHLLDWGIAVRAGEVLPSNAIAGTPIYMAPEMLRPQTGEIGASTDVYLLAATLHECVTGHAPHAPSGETSSLLGVLAHVAESPAPAYGPEVPDELAALLTRALAPEPRDRFADVRSLGRALDAFLAHRAAAGLARAAEERLAALEAAVEQGADATEVHGLFHECRFAFEQALRDWPEQPRAHSGRRRALATMGRHALAHGDRTVLASMIAVLDPTHDEHRELSAGLGELDRKRLADEAERERLRAMERENDLRVSARERAIALRVMAAMLAVGMPSFALLVITGRVQLDASALFLMTLPPLVLAASGLFLFRARLVRNRADRQIVFTLLTLAVCVLVHRVVGAARGAELADVASGDAFVGAAVAAVSALSLRRVYLVPAILLLTAAVVAPFVSRWAFVPLVGSVLTSLGVILASPRSLQSPLLSAGVEASTSPPPPTSRS